MHDSRDVSIATTKPPNSRRWTTDELVVLRRLARTMTAAQIGLRLDRTALAVRTKAAHERIRLKPEDGDGAPHARGNTT